VAIKEGSEEEREENIQKFMKKVLKFLKEQKCIYLNRDISGDYVRIEYGSLPQGYAR